MTDTPPKLDIDWLKTLAGALAAVTTAVLLSTLGAAGTLIGAALGSVAATVGTALYSQGLASSREKVAKVQETALQKVGVAQAEVRRAARRQGDDAAVEAHLEHADEQLAEAQEDLDGAGDGPSGLPWRRIGVVAAGTFVVVVLVLSAFELLGGRPVSSYTGGSDGDGTSISRLTGSGDDQSDGDRDDQQDGNPTPTPSQGASTDPGADPSESTDPTEQPSAEPTDQPSATPTETPTPSPSPSSTPSVTTSPSATLSPTPSPSPAG